MRGEHVHVHIPRQAAAWAVPMSSRETCSSGCTAAGRGSRCPPPAPQDLPGPAEHRSGTPASLATSMP